MVGLLGALAVSTPAQAAPPSAATGPASGSRTITDGHGSSVTLADRTILLDAASVAALTGRTETTVTFAGSPAQLRHLAPGAVLVHRSIAGRALYVTGVTRTAAGLTVTVRPATTTEAYSSVKVRREVTAGPIQSVTGALQPLGAPAPSRATGSPKSTGSPGSRMAAAATPETSATLEASAWATGVKWKAVLASEYVKSTGRVGGATEGSVTAEGELSYDPKLTVTLDTANRVFAVTSTVQPTVKLSVTGNVSATLKKDASSKIKLGQLHFAPVVFFVGPVPFTVAPDLEVGLDISGKVSAEGKLAYECSPTLTAGFQVGAVNKTVQSFTGCDKPFAITPSFSATGKLEAKVELTLFAKVDEIAGPFITVALGGEADFEPLKRPWLTHRYKATMLIGGRVDAKAWSKDVAFPEITLKSWGPYTIGDAFKGVNSVTATYSQTARAVPAALPGELVALRANVTGVNAAKVTWRQTAQSVKDLWFVDTRCTLKSISATNPPTSGVCARRSSIVGQYVKAYTYRDTRLTAATPVTSKAGTFTQGAFAFRVTPAEAGTTAATANLVVNRTKAATPGAVNTLTATPTQAGAIVRWNTPVDNGGSYVSRYVVTATTAAAVPTYRKSITRTAYGTTLELPGVLAEKVPYTVTVRAINAVGTGPAVTTSVTPLAPIRASATQTLTALPAAVEGRVILSGDAKQLFYVTHDPVTGAGTVTRRDLATGREDRVSSGGGATGSGMRVVSELPSADRAGRWVIFDGTLIDFAARKVTDLSVPGPEGPERPDTATVSGDGGTVFTANTDGKLFSAPTAAPSQLTSLPTVPGFTHELAPLSVSYDGKRVAARVSPIDSPCGQQSAAMLVRVDLHTASIVSSNPCPTWSVTVQAVAISGNGRYVTFWQGDQDGDMFVIDLNQPAPRKAYRVPASPQMTDFHILEFVEGLAQAAISDDGRVVSWLRVAADSTRSAACDRFTGSCAAITSSERSDGPAGEPGAWWWPVDTSADLHTVTWLGANNTVMRRTLTW